MSQPINLPSTLILEDVRTRVVAAIERAQLQLDTARTIVAALTPFDGKPLSKRLATAVGKALGDSAVVHWSDEYNTLRMTLWGKSIGVGYDERMSFYMGRKGDTFSLAAFASTDMKSLGTAACYLLNEGRIPEYEKVLAELDEHVPVFNEALVALTIAMRHFAPIGWAVFPS